MSEQEGERPPVAKSPRDGGVSVKRPAKVDKKQSRYPCTSPQDHGARFLAHLEKLRRALPAKGGTFEAWKKQCNKNTEDIRALENKYEELHSTIEALQRELRGRSNCVDQI
ncbi:hypothetical protein FAGAP_5768 [Fusarium agapanthi]|uniref:Uncharacterized protein n=1 Tax=Fusarium agapanthi TaxID=1803897 RepID=A0A9P5B9F8_9HYPO|nr:hypothetical protein FAGAP_5768 [Fusarium agapanthi]